MIKQFILFLFVILTAFELSADDGNNAPINIQHQSPDNHSEHYIPSDMPVVYFDSDEMEIIIEAEGFADYYIVEVIPMQLTVPVIYTQIDGYGDTIDVSSLSDGYYEIIITSSNNNVFEGYFTIE